MEDPSAVTIVDNSDDDSSLPDHRRLLREAAAEAKKHAAEFWKLIDMSEAAYWSTTHECLIKSNIEPWLSTLAMLRLC